jgi:hypothetical protein
MPVILTTQEAENRRIAVQGQLGQIVHETYLKKTLHKKGLVEWLKVQALSSDSSTIKKERKKINPYQKLQVIQFKNGQMI